MQTPSNPTEWHAFFSHLMSAHDPNVRSSVEGLLKNLQSSNPQGLISSLMQCICDRTGSERHVREFCAILLRRQLISTTEQTKSADGQVVDTVVDSSWSKLSDQSKTELKAELLKMLVDETDGEVRAKLGDAIGVLGQHLLFSDDGWQELFPFLFQWASSPNMEMRERVLGIFAVVGSFVGMNMPAHFPTLVNVLQPCMTVGGQSTTPGVLLESFNALAGVLMCVRKEKDRDVFAPLLPSMLNAIQVLGTSTEKQASETGTRCFELVLMICSDVPRFFRHHMSDTCQMMIELAKNTTLRHEIRRSAVEFLLCMAEQRQATVRKLPGNMYVTAFLPVLAEMTIESRVPLLDAWANSFDDDGLDDDQFEPVPANLDLGDSGDCTNSQVALEALDRLANCLGHAHVIPATLELVNQMMSNADAKCREAGLDIVMYIAEAMGPRNVYLAKVVPLVLHGHKDASPRVQVSAIKCLSQMFNDCGLTIHKKYHTTLLPVLSASLQSEIPRLQANTAVALTAFCIALGDDETSELGTRIMSPHVEGLLRTLFYVLEKSQPFVREHVLSAIARTARCAGASFGPYYKDCMPILKNLLSQCNVAGGKEAALIRSRLLDCISLMGESAGKETFMADCMELIQVLVEMSKHPMIDEERVQVFTAWKRIASCLREDFVPHLPLVLPQLFQVAGKELSYKQMSEEDVFGGDEDDETNVTNIAWKQKFFSVHTSELDDKEEACHTIMSFVTYLKAAFFPHVEQALKIFLPLVSIKNNPHDVLRSLASATTPDLLNCATAAVSASSPMRADVDRLSLVVIDNLVQAMLIESSEMDMDMETLKTQIQALKASIAASTCCAKVGSASAPASPSAQNGSVLQAPGTPPAPPSPGGGGNASEQAWDEKGAPCPLDSAKCMEICEAMLRLMQNSMQRRAVAAAENTVDEDADDQAHVEFQSLLYTEEQLLYMLAEIIGQLFKSAGVAMVPVVDQLLYERIVGMCDSRRLTCDQVTGIFVIDDMLEHIGEAVSHHLGPLITILMQATTSDDPTLCQGAVFGIGICAQKFGRSPGFVPYVQPSLQALTVLLQQRDTEIGAVRSAEDEDVERPRMGVWDNAVSALGKFALHCEPSTIDQPTLVQEWLKRLPLDGDVEEGVTNVKIIVEELARENVLVVGANGANLPHIAGVLGKALSIGMPGHAEVQARVVTVMKQLESHLGPETIQKVLASLSAEQQAKLHHAMSQ